jgi:hypothetical protein
VIGLCRRISQAEPVFLPFVDLSLGYQAGNCHANVLHRARTAGGERVNGWMIWVSPPSFAEAEFHCVWRSPNGEFVDITPRADREERILFLPDPSTRLTRGPRGGILQPCNRNMQGGYSVFGMPYQHPAAENAVSERAREHCARLGLDPFAVCDDEALGT